MDTTITYQKISPLDVALGAFYNLSKKAQKEFIKVITRNSVSHGVDAELMKEIEEGRQQISRGESVMLATDEDFDAYFKTV